MITQHATGCAHATRAIESKNVSVATNVTVVVCELDYYRAYRAERKRRTRESNARRRQRECVYENERERLTTNVQERQARVFERERDKEVILCYRGVHSRSNAFTAVRVGRLRLDSWAKKSTKSANPARQRSLTTLSAYCRARLCSHVHFAQELAFVQSRPRSAPSAARCRAHAPSRVVSAVLLYLLYISLVTSKYVYICNTDIIAQHEESNF